MKQKLKKIGLLAVLLALGTFSQVGKAQEVIDDATTLPILGGDGSDTRAEYVILQAPLKPPIYVCYYCGSDCIVVSCTKK